MVIFVKSDAIQAWRENSRQFCVTRGKALVTLDRPFAAGSFSSKQTETDHWIIYPFVHICFHSKMLFCLINYIFSVCVCVVFFREKCNNLIRRYFTHAHTLMLNGIFVFISVFASFGKKVAQWSGNSRFNFHQFFFFKL